ncbi:pyruvate kinase [Streptomyces sp. SPB162]|nr:pyruvate kinase [Streptomyces sp. SPB162]
MVRLSMSNGTREQHINTVALVRELATECGRPVRILADLQGRKNRLGRLPGGQVEWLTGDHVVLTTSQEQLTSHRTWTLYPWIPNLVQPGSAVLIDDGAVVLTVQHADSAEMHCTVAEGGTVTDGRGFTIPGATTFEPGLNQKDADDLLFAADLGVDLVALSFACSAEDYAAVHALAPSPLVIGKVEHPDAVKALSSMAGAFDGLMVARGDLALEIAFEDVPIVQKSAVRECSRMGKTSMVATQLLHSMRESSLPARAEVADIFNAVVDGADALVLTGETGYGKHPVRVVEVMRRVIESAERHLMDAGPSRTSSR